MAGGVIPVGTVATTQVVAKNKRIRIDYSQNKFHENILAISSHYVLPIVQKQIEAGKKVHFGAVELEKDHIYLKGKQYDLKQVKKVKVESGRLVLKLKGDWFKTKIMVRDIANIFCLVQLIETENNPED